MIAVDTNLLIYAHREDADFHPQALRAVLDLAESGNRWAIPWPCIHEFLAVVTHPRIFTPPTPQAIAFDALDAWLGSPWCRTIGEGPGYFETLRVLVTSRKVVGPMVHDARVAAICLHHGVRELWTADRDFSRFSALSTRNPLVS